jgi:hypothetical protein
MVFRFEERSVSWVTMALRTITVGHEDLRRVSIHFVSRSSPYVRSPLSLRRIIGDETYTKWMDLDRVLVQLCESHAFCLGVRCLSPLLEDEVPMHVEFLLPEAAKRGMVRLLRNVDLS